MHEAKRHRAKCSRVRGFKPLFRLSARRRGILSGQCGFGASRFKHLRREEASARSFRAFSTSGGFEARIFKLFPMSGGFGASILEHVRCLEVSERAFSEYFDVWRLRSEVFEGFSTRAGRPARQTPKSHPSRQRVIAKSLPESPPESPHLPRLMT